MIPFTKLTLSQVTILSRKFIRNPISHKSLCNHTIMAEWKITNCDDHDLNTARSTHFFPFFLRWSPSHLLELFFRTINLAVYIGTRQAAGGQQRHSTTEQGRNSIPIMTPKFEFSTFDLHNGHASSSFEKMMIALNLLLGEKKKNHAHCVTCHGQSGC